MAIDVVEVESTMTHLAPLIGHGEAAAAETAWSPATLGRTGRAGCVIAQENQKALIPPRLRRDHVALEAAHSHHGCVGLIHSVHHRHGTSLRFWHPVPVMRLRKGDAA